LRSADHGLPEKWDPSRVPESDVPEVVICQNLAEALFRKKLDMTSFSFRMVVLIPAVE
jgi:hypothetical protein